MIDHRERIPRNPDPREILSRGHSCPGFHFSSKLCGQRPTTGHDTALELHPWVTHHVTHATIGRMFLPRPDDVVNQIMLFCLFPAAENTGELVESNHVHLVITDVRGELSEFMRRRDRSARSMTRPAV